MTAMREMTFNNYTGGMLRTKLNVKQMFMDKDLGSWISTLPLNRLAKTITSKQDNLGLSCAPLGCNLSEMTYEIESTSVLSGAAYWPKNVPM